MGVSHPTLVSDIRGHAYGQPLTTMRRYLDAMEASRPHVTGKDTPIVLGALGPKMSALGAERCAGVHPFNAPVSHTRRTRSEIGPRPWICTAQHICLESDPAVVRAAARQALGFYFITPNYQRHWLSLGFAEHDFKNGGSDRLIDALVAWGSETDIRERIAEHFDAGATQVIINTINPSAASASELPNAIAGRNFQSAPHWEAFERLRPS
ncbi:MAG: LLM class flavin-dependent oxidoreductase [Gammaproteobacteria bacterium]|nr:LLM class flavin-dependent oxidoreductase [Gammaproteobacteria bacterium]